MSERESERLCAMPCSQHGNSPGSRAGDPCTWPVEEVVEGRPLCYVHARAVIDGTRPLPELPRGP